LRKRSDRNVRSFLLYRKFLKSSEIVYNGLEIKNDITKERKDFAMMLLMKETALSGYRKRIIMSMDLSISHNLLILFK